MKRTLFLVIAMFFMYQVVLAEMTVSDDEINKIYDSGYEAYHAKDYVMALEYFFVYRVLNKELWNKNPEFGEKFDKTISSIEKIINNELKAQGYEWKEDKRQLETDTRDSSKGN